ncbi:MAG: 1-acyl-sn-glycerol-3-phosphate acyltransferase [Spirochaetia bacterium]|nr:1-acyl-sn-glycerol-3-phosphate acyltransferase [Spirochaetia bacterium]
MDAFLEPTFNLGVAWAVDAALPLLLKTSQNLDGVIISAEDKAALRSLRNERLIYCSNHPSQSEPPVAYYTANVMGARFNYMAARHLFDWGAGFMGRLFQNVGAFSVIAGTADRESIKMARSILGTPSGKLVLFPEGEPTSGENDSLLPFQPGVAQLGFWGLEEARKEEPEADIAVLPVFVKYVISGNREQIRTDIEVSVRLLEKKLGIDPGEKNLLRRFLTVGRVLLEREEKAYNIAPASRADYDYRIGRVRHTILDNVASKLQITGYDTGADAIVKLRHLLAIIDMIGVGFKDPRLPNPSRSDLEWARTQCLHAYDFIVIKRDYLVSYPSPERFYEWLGRFESQVYGGSRVRARKAHVLVGKPFRLSEHAAAYRDDKRKAVDRVTKTLRAEMERLLERSLELSKPLVQPADVGE